MLSKGLWSLNTQITDRPAQNADNAPANLCAVKSKCCAPNMSTALINTFIPLCYKKQTNLKDLTALRKVIHGKRYYMEKKAHISGYL